MHASNFSTLRTGNLVLGLEIWYVIFLIIVLIFQLNILYLIHKEVVPLQVAYSDACKSSHKLCLLRVKDDHLQMSINTACVGRHKGACKPIVCMYIIMFVVSTIQCKNSTQSMQMVSLYIHII